MPVLDNQPDPEHKGGKADDDRDNTQHDCGDRRLAVGGLVVRDCVQVSQTQRHCQTAEQKSNQQHTGDEPISPRRARRNEHRVRGWCARAAPAVVRSCGAMIVTSPVGGLSLFHSASFGLGYLCAPIRAAGIGDVGSASQSGASATDRDPA